MTTFCLVHGAWHGAWCWERLVPELEVRGGRVVTPDLPCEDVAAGISAYADVVDAALGDADDVVLVGHSLAGATIPLVAARRPVRALVFLCALIPTPGEPITGAMADGALLPGFAASTVKDELERTYWPDPAAAVHDLFHEPLVLGRSRRRRGCGGRRARRRASPARWRSCPMSSVCPSSAATNARSTPSGRERRRGSCSESSRWNCPARTRRSCRGPSSSRSCWLRSPRRDRLDRTPTARTSDARPRAALPMSNG